MSTTVNIHEAKTHLSRLLVRVGEGEEVVIAKNGLPLARLVPISRATPRVPGRFAGQCRAPDSAFFDPLPEDELDLWSGAGSQPLDPLRKRR